MKHIILIASIACLAALESCKKDTHPLPAPTDAGLRILNATPWDFTECVIDLPSMDANIADPPPHDYGTVNVNAKTGYKIFPAVFGYSYIRVIMNNKTYTFTPYDYVGETGLTTGRFTYKLTYSASSDRLNLQFMVD